MALAKNIVVRITLKPYRSKWGSYNYKTKTIALNVMLGCFDLHVLDYVIIHELTHAMLSFTEHHSKYFYLCLSKFCPGYKKCEQILKTAFLNN